MKFSALFLLAAAVIGVCAGSPTSLSETGPDVDWCGGCKTVVNTIKKFVHDAGEEKMETFLKYVCDLTPLPLSLGCKFAVSQYGAQIFDVIEKLEDEASCEKLHLCPNTFLFAPRVQDKCATCTSSIDSLKKTAATKGKAQVKQQLESLCKVAVGFEQECTMIVDNYFDMVFDFIINHTSFEICQKAGMC